VANFSPQGYHRKQLYTPTVFAGKQNERILFYNNSYGISSTYGNMESHCNQSSVMPINVFTFNVCAYVDIIREQSYGSYSVIINNKVGIDLILNFIIRPEGIFNVDTFYAKPELTNNVI